MKTTIGFIGFGLIGGSIARALRKAHPDYYMLAYSRTRAKLELALSDGVLNEITDEVGEAFRDCDIVFLCTPVSYNADYLKKVSEVVTGDCILTDVGSTKGDIHEVVSKLGLESRFIGGHPMAGSEKTGYENSTATLLENAYYVLTPGKGVTNAQVNRMVAIANDVKAIPLILNPKNHDFIVGGISHLPHVVAASLVNLVEKEDSDQGLMRLVAAGGFKDITRIASSSPEMWQQICLTNGDNVVALLKDYIAELTKAVDMIEAKDGEAIYELFDNAREYRSTFAMQSSGPIKSDCLFCDLDDVPGAIAMITTALAVNQISIKNIAILHNREFVDGTLMLQFYEEAAMNKAQEILAGYNVITRRSGS